MKKETLKDPEITISRLSTSAEFAEIKDAWTHLFLQNHNQSVFLSWEWLSAWWEIYGEEKELWILIAQDSNTIVGIAPLVLTVQKRAGIKLRVLQTMGMPLVDVGGFLITNESKKITLAFLAYINQHKNFWDILEFNEFVEDGVETATQGSFFAEKKYPVLKQSTEHYYIPTHEDWLSYYDNLSKKFRKNLRRSLRNADKLGKVKFKAYTGHDVNWDVFEKIIEINRHAHYPRLAHSQSEQKFHQELLKNIAHTARFSVYLLFIDEKPAAYEYGFYHNGRFEDWRAGFDTRYDTTVSIGKLLSLKITEHAFGQGYKEIDFMRGDEDYKKDWKPLSRAHVNTRIFQPRKFKSLLAFYWLRSIKPLIRKKN